MTREDRIAATVEAHDLTKARQEGAEALIDDLIAAGEWPPKAGGDIEGTLAKLSVALGWTGAQHVAARTALGG